MISWTSSSASSRFVAGLAALAITLGGCRAHGSAATAAGAARAPFRVALLPVQNLAGVPLPLQALERQIERMAVEAGLDVVAGDRVERFLTRHRLRYTGGIDEEAAVAAHDDLGVDGVLLSAIEAYDDSTSPRLALTLRVVSASRDARILWIDGTARTGGDSPGLFGLGIIRQYRDLESRELRRLGASLVAALSGGGPIARACPGERRFRPRIVYRAPQLDPSRRYSVAVLPFVNETSQRRAGDLVALEFARQFAAVDRVRVLEPGVVRDRLIRYRVIMQGGISVDAARLVLDMLQADLVVTGYVREFVEGADPRVNFTILALERQRGLVVWESTSHAAGSRNVWLFGIGQISTASALTCRMAHDTVAQFLPDQG